MGAIDIKNGLSVIKQQTIHSLFNIVTTITLQVENTIPYEF